MYSNIFVDYNYFIRNLNQFQEIWKLIIYSMLIIEQLIFCLIPKLFV